jgi:hypothetical protein
MESKTSAERRLEYLNKWREDHREHLAELSKAYYTKHKEAIDAWKAKKNECDVCGGSYTNGNKSLHEKSEQHQRALNDKRHKEAMDARKAQKFECDVCGGRYTYYNKSIHEMTKRHQESLNAKTKQKIKHS